MKKAVLFLIMFFAISVSPSYSYTLKGEVTYTVERARKEAFTNVEYSLPQSIIDKNIKDPNFKENIKAIKLGATELKDRSICYYEDGGYSVLYKNSPNYIYYYFQNGSLSGVEVLENISAPTKTFRYNELGKLTEISIILSSTNSYIFSLDGELKGHWVGNKCYDKNGKLIFTRNQ